MNRLWLRLLPSSSQSGPEASPGSDSSALNDSHSSSGPNVPSYAPGHPRYTVVREKGQDPSSTRHAASMADISVIDFPTRRGHPSANGSPRLQPSFLVAPRLCPSRSSWHHFDALAYCPTLRYHIRGVSGFFEELERYHIVPCLPPPVQPLGSQLPSLFWRARPNLSHHIGVGVKAAGPAAVPGTGGGRDSSVISAWACRLEAEGGLRSVAPQLPPHPFRLTPCPRSRWSCTHCVRTLAPLPFPNRTAR
jgi:hypothetical protein